MTAREIITELGEALGITDQAQLLTRINRATELLSVKDLFDPLIGYLNFSVSSGNFIALPREVRTVLSVNINGNPSYSRDRFYEFDLNTPGTVLGDSVEFEWADRCNVCVQDERPLPGNLTYRPTNAADNNLTCTIEGRDAAGRVIVETITGNSTTPVASVNVFHEVIRVYRDATAYPANLYCNTQLIGQYYADETNPVYRSIRLSRAASNVRLMFRREPLNITTLDSFIPLNSPMAVIQAAKACGHLIAGEDELADACMARAQAYIKEDQSSREEGDTLAQRQDAGTLGVGLLHSEGITVLDVYDTACEIFGKKGRNVIFKKITQAVQGLTNAAHWDGMMGAVDIWPRSHAGDINQFGGLGHGYYTLPRFIAAPLSINVCGRPMEARNQWFDFHLNGLGERVTASIGKWDDLGEVCLSDCIPHTPGHGMGQPIPTSLLAICDNALDDGKLIRIFGREALPNGQVAEVYRNGCRGWTCPCVSAFQPPAQGDPKWVEVWSIERAETRAFVRLWATATMGTPGTPGSDVTTLTTGLVLTGTWSGTNQSLTVWGLYTGSFINFYGDPGHTILIGQTSRISPVTTPQNIQFQLNGSAFVGRLTNNASVTNFTITRTVVNSTPVTYNTVGTRMLGFWYPDETKPSYRLIRLHSKSPQRIRVLYRTHFHRVRSLFDPIPLRSSLAVENMLRALKAQEMGLVSNAMPLEALALKYLTEDRIKDGQSEMPTLQFDVHTAPGGWENVT